MNHHLGNLEEGVLLLVMSLGEAYGVSVAAEYTSMTGHTISVPAIHTVLHRLEDKGMLRSKLGEASPERGGRRKRLYEPTAFGYNIAREIRDQRVRVWSRIPKLKLS